MFGRKKRYPYFFYPPDGVEQIQYRVPDVHNDNYVRQQPSPLYPYPFPPPQGIPVWYQNQLPYNMSANYFPIGYPNGASNNYSYADRPSLMNQSFSQKVFQNPLQPAEEPYTVYYPQQMYAQASFNPYPKQAYVPKQPSGIQMLMNSFKSQDGSVDINKMVNTAGQMAHAVTQVSSMLKGLSGMLKT